MTIHSFFYIYFEYLLLYYAILICYFCFFIAAGKLQYSIALNLTKYLLNENDYVPWRTALSALNFIDTMLITGPDYHLFKVR